ncbi:MotA/TolQ/ExbB proton channel family protein, partial [Candidatus Dependentiae bacterium]|nr:MotA/TolQ/ExbB proton channel family protein [Candidatus Dependentiae bacterium]
TSISRIAAAILENYDNTRDKLEIVADEIIISEIPKLERHIGFLGIIATIEPLLGLLGTVTGMIKAFFVISNISLSNPAQLANGIAEALYTTAAGLIVGIPAIAAYNYFMIRIESINWDMEQITTKLINYICAKSDK